MQLISRALWQNFFFAGKGNSKEVLFLERKAFFMFIVLFNFFLAKILGNLAIFKESGVSLPSTRSLLLAIISARQIVLYLEF